jgi:hypothetical protein
MKKILFGTIALIAIAILAASCNTDEPQTSDNSYKWTSDIAIDGTDVYITGFAPRIDNDDTWYWKNGVWNELPGGGSVSAIAIAGTDVYIAGHRRVGIVGDQGIAGYWKNGVWNELPRSGLAAVNAVAIAGTDVYFVGRDSYNPVYWKNGVRYELDTGSFSNQGWAEAIAITGTDVYIVYRDYSTDRGLAYWKNGVLNPLEYPANKSPPRGASIAIDGTDVYITNPGYLGYWKNGARIEIGFPSGYSSLWNGNEGGIAGIAIYNGSVYIAGSLVNEDGFAVPMYWKDGMQHSLTWGVANIPHTPVTGIAIDGTGTLYITGNEYINYKPNDPIGSSGGISDGYKAVYWKGGVRYELEQ